jgi:hypothetical protein
MPGGFLAVLLFLMADKATKNHAKTRKAKKNADKVLGKARSRASMAATEAAEYEALQERKLRDSCTKESDLKVCIVAYGPENKFDIVYYAENYSYYDIDIRIKLSKMDEHFVQSLKDKRVIVSPKKKIIRSIQKFLQILTIREESDLSLFHHLNRSSEIRMPFTSTPVTACRFPLARNTSVHKRLRTPMVLTTKVRIPPMP